MYAANFSFAGLDERSTFTVGCLVDAFFKPKKKWFKAEILHLFPGGKICFLYPIVLHTS
jgi:hypothetical protein